MSTAYIFCHDFSAESYDYLALNGQGEITQKAQKKSLDEIRAFQDEVQSTVVVLCCRLCSIFHLELPLLAEKKARMAIPFALEDRLAQNIEEIHFAFEQRDYKNGKYLVATVDKQQLIDLKRLFADHHIPIDKITIDWCALNEHEACVTGSGILLNHPAFSGFISHELESAFSVKIDLEPLDSFAFNDSIKSELITNPIQSGECSSEWLAKRLLHKKPLNLLQGKLSKSQDDKNSKPWYAAALVMAIVWLASVFASNLFWVSKANNQINKIDQQIAKIYYQFFPDAKIVVSPRFRIAQKIKESQSSSDQQLFVVLNALAKAHQKIALEIEQIRYQNKSMQVSLLSTNFQIIEDFQNALSKEGLRVKQLQATTKDNAVHSIVELTS